VTPISREELIQELKKFVASLEHARVAAEDYHDPRAIKLVEQTLKEARELLKRAETELRPAVITRQSA
jgi:hypothetical protein